MSKFLDTTSNTIRKENNKYGGFLFTTRKTKCYKLQVDCLYGADLETFTKHSKIAKKLVTIY